MNTVRPALHSATAVAGARRTGQPSNQSDASPSWDATYDDARAAADKDSPARLAHSASGAVTADGVDGKPAKTGSASGQPGGARSSPVIGNGEVDQGAYTAKDDKIANSAPPTSDGNGPAIGDPTAGASPADIPPASRGRPIGPRTRRFLRSSASWDGPGHQSTRR